MTPILDSELMNGYDVEAAITRGLLIDGAPRRVFGGEAAIAASYQAEALHIGPYPLNFLAQYVRAGGFASALDLPEPVIGPEARELVRGWLRAAAATGANLRREVLFAHWLASVALLIAMRRDVRGKNS
ncbi:hypothetical protein [Kitasatospora aureofaciens]|uniref:hypothetical protein n=1 Tax=Kitasatospora aureofaciens TaxID=1894 RepID=UPI0037CBEC01